MSELKRVLVVDDDIQIAQLLGNKLTALGYEVELQHRGKTVLEAARRFKPWLILLDVMLGDELGYHVARTIRADRILYKTPILFQSVIGDERDVSHAYSEGGDGYLRKPYSAKDFESGLTQMKVLQQELEWKCPKTGFVSMSALRRETDHQLFRNEPFGMMYLVAEHVNGLDKGSVKKELVRTTEITSSAIRATIRNSGFYETMPSNMGGGYFMVKMNIEDVPRFETCITEEFNIRMRESIRQSQVKYGRSGNGQHEHVPLHLLVGTATTENDTYHHATQLFDALRGIELTKKTHEAEHARKLGHEHWAD